MTFVTGLQCRGCGESYRQEPLLASARSKPIVIRADKKSISREKIGPREPHLWRYRQLLPIAGVLCR